MRESSRRRIARTRAPDVKSWEYDHELCLLSGLLEARRAGRFNASAETYRRQDVQNLLVLLKRRHEGYVWELKSVENKCKDLKQFWSAFKEAKDFTRATYDASSGELHMIMRREDLLMERGGPYTMRILISGLTTDDEITYEAWEEIFSNDQLIASRSMYKAAGTKGDASTTTVDPPDEETGLLVSDSQESDSLSEVSTLGPLSPISRLKVPSSTVSNIIKVRKQKAKRPAGKRQEEALRQVTATMTARASQPRVYHHVIMPRITGAEEDVERALKDCLSMIEERGLPFVNRVEKWIKEDAINAIIWNALPSKEAKDAWLAHKFPEST